MAHNFEMVSLTMAVSMRPNPQCLADGPPWAQWMYKRFVGQVPNEVQKIILLSLTTVETKHESVVRATL